MVKKVAAIISVAVLVTDPSVVACTQAAAAVQQEKWYYIGHFQTHQSIEGDPSVEAISAADAARLFSTEFAHRPGNRGEIRYAEDPTLVRDAMLRRAIPLARLTAFSEAHLNVEVIEALPPDERGIVDRRKRTAQFVVPRDEAVDQLFDVKSAVEKFTLTYKGIGQGSSVFFRIGPGEPDGTDDVSRALGKPDETNYDQLMQLRAYYFAKDDVNIFCNGGSVYYIERGKPDWLIHRERERAKQEAESGATNEQIERGPTEKDTVIPDGEKNRP